MIKVVFLGSGFGGMESELTLESRLGKERCGNYPYKQSELYVINPLLPQIVSSYIEPRHIIQTIRDIRRDKKFRSIQDSVIGIDLNKKLVRLSEVRSLMNILLLHLVS